MKAVRIYEYGGPEVLKYESVSKPEAIEKEVLIRVMATSVNHLEVKITSGVKRNQMPVHFPWIPGFDLAGVIESIGSSVENFPFQVGDKVYAKTTGGTYAEYIAVDPQWIARQPEQLIFTDAASIPHVGLTAWQALYTHGQLQPGQKVLIHGGAGGVGEFAIQFAKITGATVYTTASAKDSYFVGSLGADTMIDYKSVDFTTQVKDLDLVLDLVGGDTLDKSYGVIRPGGTLVTTAGTIDQKKAREHQIHATGMVVQPDGKALGQITEWIEAGKVKYDVAEIYPLAEVISAWNTFLHKSAEARKFSHGKVVLEV
ncbi:MAG: NADP-dependent oxidoreductase [Tannerellaceae bacterium]|nr:NADP-dependent oxidoreductase [Tannerellaceae bacterium]